MRIVGRLGCLAVVATYLCGIAINAEAKPIHSKIIDGQLVPVSEYPYVASMSLGDFICTGTLVGSKYVLTAAHCFFDEKNKKVTDISSYGAVLNGTFYKAAKVTVNPTYVSRSSACIDGERDAAIMELESEPQGISPIALQRTTPTAGQQLLLVGFGTQGTGNGGENGTFPGDGKVNRGSTSIESVDGSYVNWTFDANAGEANTAGGDSGGPAFADIDGVRYINSITCGGTGNAGFNTTSSNTRADVIAAWVDSVIGTSPENQAPSFITLPTQTVGINQAFSYQIQVTGTAPISLSVDGDLPAGLTLSGSTLSGALGTAGSYTINLVASNSVGSATGSLVIKAMAFDPGTALSIAKVTVSFNDEEADLLAIQGKITLGSKFSPRGARVSVTVAELTESFKLNKNGRAMAPGGFDSVRLIGKISKGKFTKPKVGYYIGLGDNEALYDGLDQIFPVEPADGDTASLPLQIVINGVTYDNTVSMVYDEDSDTWVNE